MKANRSAVVRSVAIAALFFLPMSALHPGFNITLGDFMLGLFLFLAFNDLRFRTGSAGKLSVAIALVIAIASVLSSMFGRGQGSTLDAAQASIIFLIVLPLGWNLVAIVGERTTYSVLALSGLTQALIALLQLSDPDLRLPTQATSGVVEFGMRPVGLSGNPNGLGLVMTWTIPIAVRLAVSSGSRVSRLFWAATVVLIALGGGATFSKITWLLIPISTIGALLMEKKRRGELALFLTLFVIAAAWTQREILETIRTAMSYRMMNAESLGDRLVVIDGAFDHIADWWLFGVGAGADTAYSPLGTRIHNQLVGFAVQFGVPATFLLVGFLACLLSSGLAVARERRDTLIVFIFLLALVALQVHPTYWARAHYMPMVLLMASIGRANQASGAMETRQ